MGAPGLGACLGKKRCWAEVAGALKAAPSDTDSDLSEQGRAAGITSSYLDNLANTSSASAPSGQDAASSQQDAKDNLPVLLAQPSPIASVMGWWVNSIFTCWVLSVSGLDMLLPGALAPAPIQLLITLANFTVLLSIGGLFTLFGIRDIYQIHTGRSTRKRLKLGLAAWAGLHGLGTLLRRRPRLGWGYGGWYSVALDLLVVRVLLREYRNSRKAQGMEPVKPVEDFKRSARHVSRQLRHFKTPSGAVYALLTVVYGFIGVASVLLPSIVLAFMYHFLHPNDGPFAAYIIQGLGAAAVYQAFAMYELKRSADKGEVGRASSWALNAALAATSALSIAAVRWQSHGTALSGFAQQGLYVVHGLTLAHCGLHLLGAKPGKQVCKDIQQKVQPRPDHAAVLEQFELERQQHSGTD